MCELLKSLYQIKLNGIQLHRIAEGRLIDTIQTELSLIDGKSGEPHTLCFVFMIQIAMELEDLLLELLRELTQARNVVVAISFDVREANCRADGEIL